MSATHKIKGIVLRTVKYGETSVITTLYTDLFGLQSYIVKGVRKSSKQGTSKINYFQAGALLDLVVYKNNLKSLQFVKDFQWNRIYRKVFSHVMRNAIAMYMVELILLSIKDEESYPELYDFFEESFTILDNANDDEAANILLHFTLHLAKFLGFQIHGKYSSETPFLNLQNGVFTSQKPLHDFVLEDRLAEITSVINQEKDYRSSLNSFPLNHIIRRKLLTYYQQFFSLHLQQTNELKSFIILQTILR